MSHQTTACTIVCDQEFPATSETLVDLLTQVYVNEGFTEARVAAEVFAPQAIRARGQLYWGRDRDGILRGTVVLVPAHSPARRFAHEGEAEIHLLAVDPCWRGQGLGRALIRTVVHEAQRSGYTALVLWTQPSMFAARRLYEEIGFVPSPQEDFVREGRVFHVLRLRIETVDSCDSAG